MSLKLGSVPTLVISSAKMGKEVMKTHDSIFASRPKLLGQQRLSYIGLDIAFCPLREVVMFVSSSFICRVAFGKRYEEGGLENRRFDQILHETQALLTGFYSFTQPNALCSCHFLKSLKSQLPQTRILAISALNTLLKVSPYKLVSLHLEMLREITSHLLKDR
ncbi:hypothetical protein LIER_13999 [Lithospermum erythrorhizon]|uniref:Uncharacterized protein n=1 Tax=Lithospermum erythrorhizon TaxID=34254 RepID=A0AAV3Q1M3_LITER